MMCCSYSGLIRTVRRSEENFSQRKKRYHWTPNEKLFHKTNRDKQNDSAIEAPKGREPTQNFSWGWPVYCVYQVYENPGVRTKQRKGLELFALSLLTVSLGKLLLWILKDIKKRVNGDSQGLTSMPCRHISKVRQSLVLETWLLSSTL